MEANKRKRTSKRYDEVFRTEAVHLVMRPGARLKAHCGESGHHAGDAAGVGGTAWWRLSRLLRG